MTAVGIGCVVLGLVGLVLLVGPAGWPVALGVSAVAAVVHIASPRDRWWWR